MADLNFWLTPQLTADNFSNDKHILNHVSKPLAGTTSKLTKEGYMVMCSRIGSEKGYKTASRTLGDLLTTFLQNNPTEAAACRTFASSLAFQDPQNGNLDNIIFMPASELQPGDEQLWGKPVTKELAMECLKKHDQPKIWHKLSALAANHELHTGQVWMKNGSEPLDNGPEEAISGPREVQYYEQPEPEVIPPFKVPLLAFERIRIERHASGRGNLPPKRTVVREDVSLQYSTGHERELSLLRLGDEYTGLPATLMAPVASFIQTIMTNDLDALAANAPTVASRVLIDNDMMVQKFPLSLFLTALGLKDHYEVVLLPPGAAFLDNETLQRLNEGVRNAEMDLARDKHQVATWVGYHRARPIVSFWGLTEVEKEEWLVSTTDDDIQEMFGTDENDYSS